MCCYLIYPFLIFNIFNINLFNLLSLFFFCLAICQLGCNGGTCIRPNLCLCSDGQPYTSCQAAGNVFVSESCLYMFILKQEPIPLTITKKGNI